MNSSNIKIVTRSSLIDDNIKIPLIKMRTRLGMDHLQSGQHKGIDLKFIPSGTNINVFSNRWPCHQGKQYYKEKQQNNK
jgi:hypothetical protein